jgi:hypothetical protein
MKLKLFILFISFFLFQNNYGQHTDVINSNRPGESMSGFSVGKTVIQIESGVSYVKEKHNLLDYDAKGLSFDFNTRYGFFKEQLEAVLEINYQNDNYVTDQFTKHRKGLKATTLGLKYLIYDPFKNYEEEVNIYSWKANHKFKWHQLVPVVSAYAGMNLNFSSNQFLYNNEELSRLSPKAMLITQNIFPGAWVFVTNIFVDKIGTNNQTLGYIVTLTKGFSDQWSGFIENKGLKGDYYADGLFSVGAAYLVNSNLQVDGFFTKNYKDTPSFTYAGFGVSWRSDTNYKDVMIRAPKKDKKKDKSKKGKEKEKAKKRLDEVQVEKP